MKANHQIILNITLHPNTMKAHWCCVRDRESAQLFEINWLQHNQMGAGLALLGA